MKTVFRMSTPRGTPVSAQQQSIRPPAEDSLTTPAAVGSPKEPPRLAMVDKSHRLLADQSPNRRRILAGEKSADPIPTQDVLTPQRQPAERPRFDDQTTAAKAVELAGQAGELSVLQSSSLDTTTKPRNKQNRHQVWAVLLLFGSVSDPGAFRIRFCQIRIQGLKKRSKMLNKHKNQNNCTFYNIIPVSFN